MIENIRGELEIIGTRSDGEVFHYEKQSNVITLWMHHAIMHLLTGSVFTSHGNSFEEYNSSVGKVNVRTMRSRTESDHVSTSESGVNNDGTMISAQHYFANNNNYFPKFWTDPNITNIDPNTSDGDDVSENFYYPFFPTKMLFGTGVEFSSWNDMTSDQKTAYADAGNTFLYNGSWDESTFNDKLNTGAIAKENYYSNTWDSVNKTLVSTRTVNDLDMDSLTTTPTTADFGVEGAIKNSLYFDQVADSSKIDSSNLAVGAYRGIGYPAFIYTRKHLRFFESSGEIYLTDDESSIENSITFTVEIPGATGVYNPYNNYILKQVGLFCDARFTLGNTVPTKEESGYELYKKMPHGMLLAKRNITPIKKQESDTITAKWTITL